MSVFTRITGSSADAQQMDKVQGAVIDALAPFKGTTEAIVIAGALLRVARMLIRLYAPKLRGGFLKASMTYLAGGTAQDLDAGEAKLRTLGFKAPEDVH